MATRSFVKPELVRVVHRFEAESVIFVGVSVPHHDNVTGRIQLAKPFRFLGVDDGILLPHEHTEVGEGLKVGGLVLVGGLFLIVELR